MSRSAWAPPRTRGDCAEIVRPCDREACRYWQAGALGCCALDQADDGPVTLAELGEIMGGVSRQEAQRLVDSALASARRAAVSLGIVWRSGDVEDATAEDRGPVSAQVSIWDYYGELL